MTNSDLLARIQGVVNRTRVHDMIAAEVMAEIERTHVLVEKGKAERLLECSHAVENWNNTSEDDRAADHWLLRSARALHPGDLAPIGHGAAESDTSES